MGAARGPASKIAALVAFIIVILVATPQAQQSASFSGVPGAITAGPAAVPPNATEIDLLVGRSTILNVGSAIARVSLTVPDIADAMVTAPQQLLIHGKTPGTISLFVWDRAGGIKTYEVSVRRDLSHLVEQMRNLFAGEQITVAGSGKDVVLSGTVSSKYVIDKAADVASGFVEKKENIVNLLKQQEGVASNQVLLRVRFAEVSRNAMQELGASMILDRFKSDAWDARTSTQQFAAPDFDSSKPGQLNFSDFLNLFVFNSKQGFGAVVKALQNKGLFQSLAEPNLIALNGKEASFLAGGEYPYPVAQGGTSNAVTIMFKEFGVRLSFTPTVLGGDLINLKVKPEVSSLDFANGVSISGFRVPALSTRRTETEVELQDGQTFAIAGLMNNTVSSTMSKIPGIGDIPVLGFLFKSRAYQKAQTELVVMITPTIVRRGSTGASQGLPTAVEPYLGAPAKPMAQPAPYIGSPRYPAGPQSRTSGAAQQNDNTTVASPATQAVTAPAPVQSAAPVAPELWTPADKQPAAQKAPKVDAKAAKKAAEAK
jgi:pilus assembly protein CpaC